jgi:formate transporter
MANDAGMPEPADLQRDVFDALAEKSALPFGTMLVLGILAGVYIGLGGLVATVALTGADALPHGVAQVLAGLVFSLGLALVVIAGAELFTGNTMMLGAVIAKEIGPGRAARALAIVYAANFLGALLLAGLVLVAGLHERGEGALGRAALELGRAKTGNPFGEMFASGILANMLVCLAVWLAYAGRSVTQKLLGVLLPVTAFVAAGLEHSVANMYLLPYAAMVQAATGDTAGAIGLGAVAGNLIPATLGNMVGGLLVATGYWLAYGRAAARESGRA